MLSTLCWKVRVRRLVRAMAPVAALLLVVPLLSAGSDAPAQASRGAVTHYRPPVPPDHLVPFKWQVPGKAVAPRSFRTYDPRINSRLPGAGDAAVVVSAMAG